MKEKETIQIRGIYRSPTHLPLWEVLGKAGIWQRVGIEVTSFEFCSSSAITENSLFNGDIDFVSGNHISPYALVAQGKPIVSIASPGNSVNDRLITREPVQSLAGIKGCKIGDTAVRDSAGGYHHPRGNHMLYVMRAGLSLEDVEWVHLAEDTHELRGLLLDAFKLGKADAALLTGNTDIFEQAGLYALPLDPLPMINGPTITTSMGVLRTKPELGERMVKAMVLGIHFAKTHQDETEKILADLKERIPASGGRYASVTKLAAKPYPDIYGVANAYQLCCMDEPKAKELSPMSLWDLHYLRDLDDSGFIDRLYGG
jgi:ABC-type nitrate/sulfonate/bicarbonate transport system substrate-binding protein